MVTFNENKHPRVPTTEEKLGAMIAGLIVGSFFSGTFGLVFFGIGLMCGSVTMAIGSGLAVAALSMMILFPVLSMRASKYILEDDE